jgi:sialic acid synthase SpsE
MKGILIINSNLKIVRPGGGAPPSFFPHFLGRTAKKSYEFGTPLSLSDLL